ncbi:LacI family DNA-binding transcriptional regulator [Bordetella sp. 15P40C-2]|uniref:LacI family DNA-binding transcriptional regulator n=1 Tax=Bordetella sp. 15P40C-2 TaxID=2572246 RepID=UPI00132B5A5A|nr:LacI family DNA-binding transcriptional regulator [Bordetella sp. 15P40C-2]MVW72912.1 substrate-binding domain-containing protein [Bordetella sp. 15P40C-2]
MTAKTPQRLSILEIAREAGVSPATVSRAFNQPGLLRPATRARIDEVTQRLGFRPNRVGRSLRAGRTRTIGLLLPTLANPVFAECFEGAEQAARRAGYSVMMGLTGYDPSVESAYAQALIDHQIDGLVLTVGDAASNATLHALELAGLPHILAYNESASHPYVSVDNKAAAFDMVARLSAWGHRRLTFVSGPLTSSDRARRRLQGARAGAKTLGLPRIAHCVMPAHTESSPAILRDLLARADAPSALFCSNDLLAMSVISQLAELGVHVPGDLAVCGFDGAGVGALLVPPLTTAAQPSRDIGATACALLLDRLAGKPAASVRLPHRIVDGGTAGVWQPQPARRRRAYAA